MRLFIALPLPAAVETLLSSIQNDLRKKKGNIKWIAPENIHLTLRFLGETDENMIEPLRQTIDEIGSRFESVATSLDGIGAFPNLSRPRIFWAGINGAMEQLSEIAHEVEQGVCSLGFEPEKKRFRPHLTLGRARNDRGLDDLTEYMEAYTFPATPMILDRIVLFQSTLTPQGAIYKRLHETKLGTERFDD